jgi:hypothetical protein
VDAYNYKTLQWGRVGGRAADRGGNGGGGGGGGWRVVCMVARLANRQSTASGGCGSSDDERELRWLHLDLAGPNEFHVVSLARVRIYPWADQLPSSLNPKVQ